MITYQIKAHTEHGTHKFEVESASIAGAINKAHLEAEKRTDSRIISITAKAK